MAKVDLTNAVPPPAAPVTGAAARPFPTILHSVGWIVLYFALQGICTTALLMSGVGGSDPSQPMTVASRPEVIVWGIVLAASVQLILMWFYLRTNRRVHLLGLDSFGHVSPLRALGLAVLLIIAAMVFNFIYATYLIPGIEMQEEMAKILAAIPRTPINVAAGFIALAIAAPLVEELLFRGFLQNAISRYLPIWAAILLSSLVFAAVHLQLYAIPGLMSLSIAFGYLYHRTGSLRMNILLHMANNILALSLTQGLS